MSEDGDRISSVVDAPSDKPRPKSGGPRASKGKKGAATDATFEYGDIVLARLRGYPPWPARITNPDDLPANVLAQRPKSSSVYCTQFFPVGDFSWLPPKDITPLRSHQIDAFIKEPHRKANGSLREAYVTAQDPTEWDAQQEAHRRELEEVDVGDEDVDELEEEDGVAVKGKRKRSNAAAAATKKEPKKAKTTTKKAAPEENSVKSKPKSDKSAKAEKKASSSNAAGDDHADDDALAHDQQAVKVKHWRHRLQRAFLTKGQPYPEPSDMEQFDEVFKTIEAYDEMTAEYLSYSKLALVMKKLARLTDVPRDDEFRITARAAALREKWRPVVGESGGNDEPAPASAAVAAAPTTDSAPEAAPAPEPTTDAAPTTDSASELPTQDQPAEPEVPATNGTADEAA